VIDAIRRHPLRTALVSVGVGILVIGIIWIGIAMNSETWRHPASAGATPGASDSAPTAHPSPLATTGTQGTSPAGLAACKSPTTTVSSATGLTAALSGAKPGDVIQLRPGTYGGNFVATASGTASAPISLCGTAASILDGGDIKSGYVFHLNAASYWHLEGFAVTNGQKGVVTDKATGVLIQGLTVHAIGDEGIHLRDFSSNNTVDHNTVSNTGMLKEKYGEGIYVGTAKSNWCSFSQCKVDASNDNTVSNNHISNTTAENVDIKEGTTGGVLVGNTFDGAGMTAADSWVDVKGNNWLIQGNTGRDSPADGFQTHQILDGWGTGNVFANNTATVDGPGYGFHITKPLGNVLKCSNTVTGAGRGVSNIACSA
jgi:parallel beta-helix repeat protein